MSTTAHMREQAAVLRRSAALLEAEADEKDRAAERGRKLRRFRPISPLNPGGGARSAVITFTRRLSGRDYQYAAVGWVDRHTGRGRWSMTGEESGRFSWVELLNFIEPENWRSIRLVHHEIGVAVRDMEGAGGTCTWGEADEIMAADEAAERGREAAQAIREAAGRRGNPFQKRYHPGGVVSDYVSEGGF
ncbi:hypothetical protein SEA_NHAGOS_75 [Gordonia phage NHagos]|nr:hypothetical protein SEA_NHAGOS_75 [Gordonia phage NHagos]